MALKFIEDPGHGWLRVDLKEFPDALESASGYGFWAGGTEAAVYLEEDMEAPDFLDRHPEIDRSAIPSAYVRSFNRNRRPLPRNLTYDDFVARRRARAVAQ